MKTSTVLQGEVSMAVKAAQWAEAKALCAGIGSDAATDLANRVLGAFCMACDGLLHGGDAGQHIMVTADFSDPDAPHFDLIVEGRQPNGAVSNTLPAAERRRDGLLDGLTSISLSPTGLAKAAAA